MSNYKHHAMREFRAAGWTNADGSFNDEMQELICNHVLKLLEVFAGEGHSGTSAPYTINLFKTLASFEPVAPLTGEDWEWDVVSEHSGRDNGPLFQNKRCGHVFKDNTGAYDSEGIVFYDWRIDEETGERYKSHFTSRESRVPVTFPYTPKTEYRERVEE